MGERSVIEVVAAIIESEGLILACRRRPEKAAGGKWEFPGGKVEPGEAPAEALTREIREELDTPIRISGPLRTDDTTVGDNIIRLTCMRAQLLGPAPTHSSDHDSLRWMPLSELATLDWAAPDRPAVAELLDATPTE
ncbi:hypothetical protein NS234_04355 [Microbacterium oxydans]|uniref:(deoxy)nucleoside triphosphate pyrophosphohydrolase n=1 Tax=Microbacterium oxydans TaxID=82380 RepID=UPI000734BA32|nr:(deoxy)nucleoside triphosphate pyrophosphohydrolase [Microbacterium oxydans]KTR78164.1 hypothetical protein NS234_04355 [Microbacterium oxydans]